MAFEKTTFEVGSVETTIGKLKFEVVCRERGFGHVQIYASDPSDGRKSGVLLSMGKQDFTQLKNLIEKTEKTVSKLTASGEMAKGFTVRY